MVLRDFNGAFELYATRAFDEDDVARRRFCTSHSPAASRIGQEQRSHSAQAGRGGQVLRIAAHADHESSPASAAALPQAACRLGPCSPSSSISPAIRMRRCAGRAASVRIMERSASGLEL